MLDKGGFALIAQRLDRGQAQLGGEFAQLSLQGVEPFKRADDMALQNMPHCHAELSRHRYRRPVAAPPRRYRQAPLLQRVIDLEEFLGRLHEKGAQRSPAMPLQGAAAFPLATLRDSGVESEVSGEFVRGGEALDLANGRAQAIEGDKTDPAEPGQAGATLCPLRSHSPYTGAVAGGVAAPPTRQCGVVVRGAFAPRSTRAIGGDAR